MRRVAILGAESTGKSTLTRSLAERFGSAAVREYDRDMYEHEGGHLNPRHFLEIPLGQRALEREAATSGQINEYVFRDTDAATTLMWSYLLTGTALPRLHALADACTARYAHTFVCSPEIAFEQDGWRSDEAVREVQQGHILQDLNSRGRAYTLVSGSVQERVAQIEAARYPSSSSGSPRSR